MEISKATIAVENIPRDQTHLYGVVDAKPANISPWGEKDLNVSDLVEKPKPAEAPSTLAVTGRYVLPPEIFSCLHRIGKSPFPTITESEIGSV